VRQRAGKMLKIFRHVDSWPVELGKWDGLHLYRIDRTLESYKVDIAVI